MAANNKTAANISGAADIRIIYRSKIAAGLLQPIEIIGDYIHIVFDDNINVELFAQQLHEIHFFKRLDIAKLDHTVYYNTGNADADRANQRVFCDIFRHQGFDGGAGQIVARKTFGADALTERICHGQFDRIGIILVVDADAKHVEIVPVICKKIGGTADAGTNLIYFQDFVALEHFVQSG